jgi:hypothetical protein
MPARTRRRLAHPPNVREQIGHSGMMPRRVVTAKRGLTPDSAGRTVPRGCSRGLRTPCPVWGPRDAAAGPRRKTPAPTRAGSRRSGRCREGPAPQNDTCLRDPRSPPCHGLPSSSRQLPAEGRVATRPLGRAVAGPGGHLLSRRETETAPRLGLLHPGGRLCLGTHSRTCLLYPPRGAVMPTALCAAR